MLLVSILGLVLKVVFQDYILEHLSICEQLALFDLNAETSKTVSSDANS